MSKSYYEPLLAPIDQFSDPLRFQNTGWGFEAIRVLSRDKAPEVISAFDADEEVVEGFLKAPENLFATPDTILMGIVNVTPDSFSDGGQFAEGAAALAQGQLLAAQGASLLDFGAESTRPGADFVPAEEEIARLMPVFDDLAELGVPVSIDTRKHEVALEAIGAGAQMINDVSALSFDEEMAPALARSEVSVCLMHAQGDPKTMQDNPSYHDVVLDVYDYLEERIAFSEAHGIAKSRIVIDPGIGFGKTLAQNLQLLRHLAVFHALGCPILLGASRKSMIAKIHPAKADERLGGSLSIALDASRKGVQILRVHDVFETKQALQIQTRLIKDEAE